MFGGRLAFSVGLVSLRGKDDVDCDLDGKWGREGAYLLDRLLGVSWIEFLWSGFVSPGLLSGSSRSFVGDLL